VEEHRGPPTNADVGTAAFFRNLAITTPNLFKLPAIWGTIFFLPMISIASIVPLLLSATDAWRNPEPFAGDPCPRIFG
jgi:hypothetical protein